MKKTLLLAGLTIAFIGSAVAQNSTQQDIENAYKSSIDPSSFKTHLQR